jgi:hypothetical protein
MEANLTEDQVRKIIRDELMDLINNNKYTFSKPIQIMDGRNIQLAKNEGTKIGTEATQKLAFHGATPIARQDFIADPAGAGDAGVDNSARDRINKILDLLVAYGFMNAS